MYKYKCLVEYVAFRPYKIWGYNLGKEPVCVFSIGSNSGFPLLQETHR